MTSIALIGGGRWARVLLAVLSDSVPATTSIRWISRHGFEANAAWLSEAGLANVVLAGGEAKLWEPAPAAAIVATASHTHAFYLEQALANGIAVLCEKPFAMDTATATRLASSAADKNLPAAVNLEFMHASYLHGFRDALRPLNIGSMAITWHDPECELRHGSMKFGDLASPHMPDQLSHVWSVVKTILPAIGPITIDTLTYSPQEVKITARDDEKRSFLFSLSRRARVRQRHIVINDGEADLDFSLEPGTMNIRGRVTSNRWEGLRPLAASLAVFLAQLESRFDCPTSLENCLPAVTLAENAQALLVEQHNAFLKNLQAVNTADPITQDLLIDSYLPDLTAKGERHQIQTPEQKQRFANYVLNKVG
jgi:hypothetical protein